MSETVPFQPSGNPLAGLATKIRECHKQVVDAGKNIVRKAIDAGEALIEAKRQVGHGNFGRWVKDNCELSERTAEVYMECARNRQKLAAIIAATANMTLAAALRAIKDKPKGDDGSLGKYEKARASLIKRLRGLSPDDIEDAANGTIAELQAVVAAIKNPASKAAA
jgi:Protein of unknown function (DUF3102)